MVNVWQRAADPFRQPAFTNPANAKRLGNPAFVNAPQQFPSVAIPISSVQFPAYEPPMGFELPRPVAQHPHDQFNKVQDLPGQNLITIYSGRPAYSQRR